MEDIMERSSPLIITISRQLGSGGAYIGHRLAEELNIRYADHDIISQTAEKLSMFREDIAHHEEKIKSFWHNLWENTGINEFYNEGVGSFIPTTAKIFATEAEVMQQIAKEHSAVFIGRCGFYVLRDFPNKVNIYLHGDIDTRSKRLQDVRGISDLEAKTQITISDRERALYIKKFTNKDWANAKNFDLVLDTSKIGFDNATEIILKYINSIKK